MQNLREVPAIGSVGIYTCLEQCVTVFPCLVEVLNEKLVGDLLLCERAKKKQAKKSKSLRKACKKH